MAAGHVVLVIPANKTPVRPGGDVWGSGESCRCHIPLVLSTSPVPLSIVVVRC